MDHGEPRLAPQVDPARGISVPHGNRQLRSRGEDDLGAVREIHGPALAHGGGDDHGRGWRGDAHGPPDGTGTERQHDGGREGNIPAQPATRKHRRHFGGRVESRGDPLPGIFHVPLRIGGRVPDRLEPFQFPAIGLDAGPRLDLGAFRVGRLATEVAGQQVGGYRVSHGLPGQLHGSFQQTRHPGGHPYRRAMVHKMRRFAMIAYAHDP